jgi:uncharacterized membrane protein YgcG
MLDDEPELALNDDEDQIGTQPMEAAVEETFVDEDEEVGMTTEPLELPDEEPEERATEKPKTVVASKRETKRAPVRSGRVSARGPVGQVENPGWVVAMVAAFLLLMYGGFFALDLLGKSGSAGGATRPIASAVSNQFFGEPYLSDANARAEFFRGGASEEGGGEGGGESGGEGGGESSEG